MLPFAAVMQASDAAIEAFNGQFLCGRQVSVMYAFKKDAKGLRHGTPEERVIAAQLRVRQAQQSRPHTLFASGPKQQPESQADGSIAHVNGLSGFAAGSALPPPSAITGSTPGSAGKYCRRFMRYLSIPVWHDASRAFKNARSVCVPNYPQHVVDCSVQRCNDANCT